MDDNNKDSRLERIIGTEGLKTLAGARVLVFGLGGVGSNCVEALARGGVGNLILLDKDEVQISNINRQAIAFHSTLGRRKVEVMRDMVLDINPNAQVVIHDMPLLPGNLDEFMAQYVGQVDYVIDAIDTVAQKLLLAQYACEHDVPLVSCMGAANKRFPECFEFADIFDTVNCPLCRIMRKEARKRGISHLKVLYSSEQPVKVASVEGADRSERTNLGTMSYVPPIMGQMLAGFVIRELLDMNSPDKFVRSAFRGV